MILAITAIALFFVNPGHTETIRENSAAAVGIPADADSHWYGPGSLNIYNIEEFCWHGRTREGKLYQVMIAESTSTSNWDIWIENNGNGQFWIGLAEGDQRQEIQNLHGDQTIYIGTRGMLGDYEATLRLRTKDGNTDCDMTYRLSCSRYNTYPGTCPYCK